MGMKYFLLNAGSLEYFVSDQKWIDCTTLVHRVAEAQFLDSDLSVEIVSILPNIANGVDFNDY